MSLVKKILIANRGEIACRIIRTAKRYIVCEDLEWVFRRLLCTVTSIGILSLSKWLIVHIGSDLILQVLVRVDVVQSYLNSDKILQIALESQCEALHPGFGFLSENAGFAQECNSKGVTFIGPPASAIVSMGSKS